VVFLCAVVTVDLDSFAVSIRLGPAVGGVFHLDADFGVHPRGSTAEASLVGDEAAAEVGNPS
jgi:hypothetical protein